MRILVLNRGSSSVKCTLYHFTYLPIKLVDPIWKDHFEWKNINQSSIEEKLKTLLHDKKIDCIGHRIVHGGRDLYQTTLISKEVKEKIRSASDLAPLHNLADLEGIEILENLYPNIPQYAIFDTAFHHTMPDIAKIYAGPYEWYENGIQRYGFHGINYQYCTKRAKQLLKKCPEKMIICHLGSGASLCAVYKGKSIDTTMGMTPLEGLVMDTRSGSIDPGVILYLAKQTNLNTLTKQLYEESGLLGLSGISSDMRDILESKDPKAKLALEVYLHQLVKMIAAMAASLKGVDVLIFTGGIGENSAYIRKLVCNRLKFLGIDLKKDSNPQKDTQLSEKVLLIHANESYQIAKECYKIQKK